MLKREFSDIKVGEKVTFSKTVTEADILAFCGVCGDFNPLHVDKEFAKKTMFGGEDSSRNAYCEFH
jgi:3-hydroxybutyryl-CoA dehydratase